MITFAVPGQRQTAGTRQGGGDDPPLQQLDNLGGRLKDSIRIGAQRSGGEGHVVVSADPGKDVVVLHIAGGPALVLHPENARDLMLAQSTDAQDRGGSDETHGGTPGSTAVVPSRLQWRGLAAGAGARGTTRGFGDVVLWGIDVITGLVTDKAADFAASAVVRRVDAQVDPGVYSLQADSLVKLKGHASPMAQVPAAADGGPLLVFIHGTFSETSGTFSKLWVEHPQRVRTLFEKYGDRVYALDHPTLGASPIANALTLARACPKGAKLHLVTHSRGGLVAEVLASVCANPDDTFEPFTAKAETDQLRDLRELAAVVKARGIRVDRMVRVACPARGTLLASGRLDAYVSVFKWTLELAGIPVAPQLVDFLGEVATRRADPEILPGLAAQIPGGPLVQWLHGADGTRKTHKTNGTHKTNRVKKPARAVGGDLRVIAGDLDGDSVTSWLKTLLADAFFWTDNDLVVQTRSMYGGAPRDGSATFVLDQGGKVSHFNYFSNERTADAIVSALVHEQPHGFRKIGPLSWAGEVASGTRAALDTTSANEKPAVVLLGLRRSQDDQTAGPGSLSLFYDDLISFLSSTHEVIEFAADWGRTIEDEGRRLADQIEAALAARKQTGKPVRLLAHSVGGLVARAMQLVQPNVWKSLMARPGTRLLMLGTPNAGFWAPMQVLSGDDTFGNTLGVTGPPFRDAGSRQLMATLPGFVQLQAGLLNDKLGLSRHATWRQLADADLTRVLAQSPWHNLEIQRDAHQWGVPAQEVLDRAAELWKNLEAQRQSGVLGSKDHVLLVVGKAPLTPEGYDVGNDGLVYLEAPAGGDGRVTLESALLPGVNAWQLDAEHTALATKKDAFAAYLELLETGTTQLLPSVRAAATTRGVASVASPSVRSRPARMASLSMPLESESDLYAVAVPRGSLPVRVPGHGTALRVTVLNGDLTFVRQPLLLGHYRALRLTGTERVVDRLVGGAMSRSLKANLYPDAPGMHQVFVNTQVDRTNPWRLPRPEAVVVLGLGEEGKLKPPHLVKAVRQGVISWAQRMAERPDDAHVPAFMELAATLIGSGGTGITVGQAAQLIAQGVREANERLSAGKWPLVNRLYLTELYLDRAIEAWRALGIQAAATPGAYVVDDTVQPGDGALSRPLDASYRGADYDFISATAHEGPNQESAIEYTLDTKRARTEVRAQSTQVPLVRELVASASNDRSQDTRIGRTLFQLLVPAEMEPFFSGTTEMVIELDDGTAGIPWELLDTNTEAGGDARPWAIRAKLLRKLRTARFRAQVVDAGADSSILVIGEPECDARRYRRLPGARAEARAVATLLSELAPLAGKVTSLISSEDPSECGADARTVMNTLLERDWRIVHIAGHGEASGKAGEAGGVVLSNGTFLGPNEIGSMRVVPELVFVNCCHLAARNAAEVLGRPPDRALFAAGVAEKLVRTGVRCVIAAGWAVDDHAANAFATTFYGALLKGQRFIDAVARAREVALARGGNTWAAYQCYGDPDWQFRADGLDGSGAQRPPTSPTDEFAGVASPSTLKIALETIAVKSRFQGAGPEELHPRLRYLENRFGDTWGGIGEVAEAFGSAWAESGHRPNAIRWYRRAIAVENASASLRAAEQLSNTLARVAAETVDEAVQQSQKRKSASAALVKAAREGRALIAEAMALLDKLIMFQPTMERESLYGSAFKRLALIEAAAGRLGAETRAIAGMQLHYRNAEAIGRERGSSNIFYPALNRIAAELALNAGRRGWKGLDAETVSGARGSLAAKVRDDPDFWSVVGQTDLDVYEAVARRGLAGRRRSIESAYEDLRARVGAPRAWASVYDTARFVLHKYAGRAAGAERKAATAVLKRLETFARVEA